MGTFEKLGILVIVVIIVMILAVAIQQWGGIAVDAGGLGAGGATAGELSVADVRDIDDLVAPDEEDEADARGGGAGPASDAATWSGGVPKVYEVEPKDKVWVLVVQRWGLKESFVPAIQRANPSVKMNRLRPGQKLVIPDPRDFRRGTPGVAKPAVGTRPYEIQVGDRLELIARKHLGRSSRWREIEALNPEVNARNLKPGQIINIPVK